MPFMLCAYSHIYSSGLDFRIVIVKAQGTCETSSGCDLLPSLSFLRCMNMSFETVPGVEWILIVSLMQDPILLGF